MTASLSLRIGPCSPDAGVVAVLRAATGEPVSRIASCLKAATPLQICDLFGLEHEEKEQVVLSLLADLGERGVPVEIWIDGEAESPEVFQNLLERHRCIAYDTRMEMDLESGDPSEEALRWATGKFEYPKRSR